MVGSGSGTSSGSTGDSKVAIFNVDNYDDSDSQLFNDITIAYNQKKAIFMQDEYGIYPLTDCALNNYYSFLSIFSANSESFPLCAGYCVTPGGFSINKPLLAFCDVDINWDDRLSDMSASKILGAHGSGCGIRINGNDAYHFYGWSQDSNTKKKTVYFLLNEIESQGNIYIEELWIDDDCNVSWTSKSGNVFSGEGGGVGWSGQGDCAEIFNLPDNEAYGYAAHAEGFETSADGDFAHAEGGFSLAQGIGAHAEGSSWNAVNSTFEERELSDPDNNSIIIYGSTAIGDSSHAEGALTYAAGDGSHAEGSATSAYGYSSHAEGVNTRAIGDCSHAEGYLSCANNLFSHAEGYYSYAEGFASHAENSGNTHGDGSHAEGWGLANGLNSHAEGGGDSASYTFTLPDGETQIEIQRPVADGDFSHAEGQATLAYDYSSHSEGKFTMAYGAASHAEGSETEALGYDSHAEGFWTSAREFSTHAEGYGTIANAFASHSEGCYTFTKGQCSHVEGAYTHVLGDFSHAEGLEAVAVGSASHAEGGIASWLSADDYYIFQEADEEAGLGEISSYQTIASEYGSHAEGLTTLATEEGAHSEGCCTWAAGFYSHAEGRETVAGGNISHVEGMYSKAHGVCSHAEGYASYANGFYSHAEGHNTYAEGDCSHAEGDVTSAEGSYSHAEGYATSAKGGCSHVEGAYTVADGDCSHAGGFCTQANGNQYAIGHYNNSAKGSGTTNNTLVAGVSSGSTQLSPAFIIGNGTSFSASNAFRVDYNGKAYARTTFGSSGADYAEYFEWADGNPNNEDRRGYFVTLDGEKIRKANENDEYLLGIGSGMPAVIGNNDEEWMGRYILDDFGAFISEEFEYTEIQRDEKGKVIGVITKIGTKFKENPDYDPNKEYIPREYRPEWNAIGMMGVLSVRDDGTCHVNGYCKPNADGIATAAESGYRVIKRINDHMVKVIFR